ncbi:MAG: SRPBCC family protein [Candidatus Thermoplasmatota archaeon]|jgi:carbon monoxide dehydrogenase subunit G|nr:SRPBCC family protein [Candidatus Thermoplasmatota archaeon]
MPKFTKSIDISASPGRVFDFVSKLDSSEYAKLNMIEIKVEKITKGKTAKGTIFHFSNKVPGMSKNLEQDSEMLEWDPPKKFTTMVKNGPLKGTTFEYKVEEKGEGGTKFRQTVDFKMNSSLEGISEKDAFQLLDKQWDEFVKRLKSAVEGKIKNSR